MISSQKVPSSKGNSHINSKIPSGKKSQFNSQHHHHNQQNEIQFYPERESFERRFNTLPDQYDNDDDCDQDEEGYSLQSSRNRNDKVCDQSEFR